MHPTSPEPNVLPDLSPLDRDGFVALPGFLPPDDLADAMDELYLMYPTAQEFHDDLGAPKHRRLADGQFGSLEMLPFDSVAWSLLAVHPRLIDVARAALATADVRLYMAEAWAKYSSATDYDQQLHRDYTNHTIVVPPDDPRFGHVEMFLYLNGVAVDTGPTTVVSRVHTEHLPVVPARRGRDAAPELYDHEQVVVGPPGTLLVYWPSTFHRGTAMRRPRAARYTLHLNYRTAAAEWVGRRGWGQWANQPMWVPFVERLTPDQLMVFGFPPPGHPYWTPRTLEGVQLRYPELDMSPWRAAIASGYGDRS